MDVQASPSSRAYSFVKPQRNGILNKNQLSLLNVKVNNNNNNNNNNNIY
jgi:hypothetical protein